jgi:hypothetical protein
MQLTCSRSPQYIQLVNGNYLTVDVVASNSSHAERCHQMFAIKSLPLPVKSLPLPVKNMTCKNGKSDFLLHIKISFNYILMAKVSSCCIFYLVKLSFHFRILGSLFVLLLKILPLPAKQQI